MTHPHTRNLTNPPPDLEHQIRQAIQAAHQDGRPTPGRPTLIRLTGATDHAVKRALASLAAQRHQHTAPPGDNDTSTADPGAPHHAPLALVTTSPDDQRQQPHQTNGVEHHQPTNPADLSNSHTTHSTRHSTSTGDGHHVPHSAGATSDHQATIPGDPDHHTRHQPTPAGGRLVAWTGFLFGSITSIAANVLNSWLPATHQPPGWTPGLAPQLGAAVWPIGLMLAVEAVSRIPWPRGLGWALARFGGAGTVALGSAVISYGHLRAVLVAWHYSPLAAAVGPLVLDGLMVVCGFALLANSLTTQHHHTNPSRR